MDINKHIVVASENGAFKCLGCESEYMPTYPMAISMLIAMIDAWTKAHEACACFLENDE